MSAIPARLAGVRELRRGHPRRPRTGRSPLPCSALPGSWRSRSSTSWAAPRPSPRSPTAPRSIARVDKIVGPGNAWVTAAKLEVLDRCAIDMPAGPTEVMVVADETADPVHVAADLLSQAEHGAGLPRPAGDDVRGARRCRRGRAAPPAADAAAARHPGRRRCAPPARSSSPRTSTEALAFADDYAPEHLSCVVADHEAALASLRHAGSLFLGAYAPESAGDYATGSNHVLPTAGAGRAYGALSVESFGRWMQVQRLTRDGLARITPAVARRGRGRGPDGPPTRRRDPLRRAAPDVRCPPPRRLAGRPPTSTPGSRPTGSSRRATGSRPRTSCAST